MQREKPSTETGLLKSLSSEEINQITILAKISEVLNSEVPPDTMFEHLLKLLCVSMKAERGFVELFSPGGEPVRFARDFSQQETREDFPYTRSLVRQCVQEGEPQIMLDGEADSRTSSMVIEGIRSVLIHPLGSENGVRGVVYLDSRLHTGEFTHNDLELLGVFANMVGIALERHQKELELEKAQRSLAEAAHGTIVRLSEVAEFRDSEGGAHLDRVSLYTELLGRKLNFNPDRISTLVTASKMHDIGKLGIPDSILLKPGRYTDYERQVMQEHTKIGARILGESDSPILSLAKTIALTHHEKWDGTGYPSNLRGEDIPLVGRIVALADVFDAITSKRRYKSAYPLEGAFDLIGKESGSHFDPYLSGIFLDARPEIERVFEENPDPPDRPVEVTSETPRVASRPQADQASLEAGVLLVDSDRFLGESLVTEATRRHSFMTQVFNIEEARQRLETLSPKVILLEATLQGAEDFVVDLRESRPQCRVTILTTDDSFSQRLKFSRLGAFQYFQKPIPAKTIMDKVLLELSRTGATRPRILVLDDDLTQLKILRRLLRNHDSESYFLSDPLELWEKLPEINPDLLILDLEMPRVSGFEICQVIRASGRWAHLPIVVITGHEDVEYYSRALEVGADDVLAKPLRPRSLLSRLDSRLKRTVAVQMGASIEPVTGLVAFPQARETAHQLANLALRLNSTATAALLRIPNFENLKKELGTAAGDRLQRNAATTISENLRSEDVITRLQDGCFLIAFPGVGKEQVRTVLESLNQKLGKLDSMESIQLDWTIVSTPEDGTSIDALIARLRAAI